MIMIHTHPQNIEYLVKLFNAKYYITLHE